MNRLIFYARWIPLSVLIGALSGIASALFLGALEFVTRVRETHLNLIYSLPIGGWLVGWLYERIGDRVEGGNNLIIDEFHDPKAVIPLRMAPLVFFGTLVTHLFGGSAGREGTAVQMSASIADQFTSRLRFPSMTRRRLLMIGMSGGFGSVFGVPFAGTIFGLEVLSIGKLEWSVLLECACSAFVAHYVTIACGIHHSVYVSPIFPQFSLDVVGWMIISGLIFGFAARLFSHLVESVKAISKEYLPSLPMRSFVGGLIVAAFFVLAPITLRYAGLGIPILVGATQIELPAYDWLGKTVMTALTVGTGFKGGEVTPLLFIGATLGNALGSILPVAFGLLAAVGLVSVFAGAANTPLACTLMAMELFGPQIAKYAALGCYTAYLVSGHHGIYQAQRIHRTKYARFQGWIERIRKR